MVKEQIVITDDQIIFPGEELDKPVIPPDPKGKLLTMLRSGIPQVSSPSRLGLLRIQIPQFVMEKESAYSMVVEFDLKR